MLRKSLAASEERQGDDLKPQREAGRLGVELARLLPKV